MISDYLHDLQTLFTKASRLGRYGFGWLGWNAPQCGAGGQKIRKQSPASGAHLSMISSECARKMLPLWLRDPNAHMGAFFARLLGLKHQSLLGSFYVWPPVGGCWEHTSTNCSSPP